MLMHCLKWWSFEIGGFLSGLISVVELGGHSVILQLANLALLLPVGFGAAANVRIGVALGAGDIKQAKISSKVVFYCTAFVCLLISCTLLALRNVMGYVFTNDRDIITLVSNLSFLLAAVHLCDGINTACGGIFRGTGRQKVGAITSFCGYYLIGFPIGLSLMFPAKLGVMGLWIGLLCPMLLQNFIYIPYISYFNWNKVCEEARTRAGVKPMIVPDPATLQAAVLKSTFGFVESGGKTMSDCSFDAIASGEDHTKQLELKDDLRMETTNVVGDILSTKQLIFRRGLALLLSISSLMIGIAIKLITTKR